MSYWRLYYHIIWATKHRAQQITSVAEPIIYRLIQGKASGLEAQVHALNGVADHVHLVVSIPPKIAISKFVGQVKGVTSARYNLEYRQPNEPKLKWQESFGIYSFSIKQLDHLISYVARQKEHHKTQQLITSLEKASI